MKNIELWEKRAGKLIVIHLQADLFSSAAYLYMQTVFLPALWRLLEAVAKSIYKACYGYVYDFSFGDFPS